MNRKKARAINATWRQRQRGRSQSFKRRLRRERVERLAALFLADIFYTHWWELRHVRKLAALPQRQLSLEQYAVRADLVCFRHYWPLWQREALARMSVRIPCPELAGKLLNYF